VSSVLSSNIVDLIIIGGGPAGYTAALRASQLGLSTLCVEKHHSLGGTCLNVGCIPSKQLLNTASLYHQLQGLEEKGIELKEQKLNLKRVMDGKTHTIERLANGIKTLFQKSNVMRLEGKARFISPNQVAIANKRAEVVWQASKAILIATGSKPIIPKGWTNQSHNIVTSEEALSFEEFPQRLLVVGAGYIGLELGSLWGRFGSDVHVVDTCSTFMPHLEPDIARTLKAQLEKQNLTFHLGATIEKLEETSQGIHIHVHPNSSAFNQSFNKALVAVGRAPYTDGLDLEAVHITTDTQGYIPVNEHFETTCPGIYAVGDVIQGPMLAHRAEKEGVTCVEILSGFPVAPIHYAAIPSVIYTTPQVASVGFTAQELQEHDIPFTSGTCSYAANGRAQAGGETVGFAKIFLHKLTERILGVHIIGTQAETIIGEATLALTLGLAASDVLRACHAHPTFSEILKEALLAAQVKSSHS
jgi:dihydrolipoamide dehydrogenase